MPTPELAEALRTGVAKAIETAGPDFGNALEELRRSVERVPPFDLICFDALYFLTVAAGTNPEFDRPAGIFLHHVEMIQAVALRRPISEVEPEISLQEGVDDVLTAAKRVTEAFMILEAARVSQAGGGEERTRARATSTLRLHAGLVRGWSYYDQFATVVRGLFEPLDAEVEATCGVQPTAILKWWERIGEEVTARIEAHRQVVKTVAELPLDENWAGRVQELYPRLPADLTDELRERLKRDDEQRRGFAMIAGDLNLPRLWIHARQPGGAVSRSGRP